MEIDPTTNAILLDPKEAAEEEIHLAVSRLLVLIVLLCHPAQAVGEVEEVALAEEMVQEDTIGPDIHPQFSHDCRRIICRSIQLDF